MTEEAVDAPVAPLERNDARSLGGVTLLGRLGASDTGIVYAGRLDGQQVAVALLTDGAETDSYARARFEQARDSRAGSSMITVAAADSDVDIAPWVALRTESWAAGLAAAQALLAPVSLADVPAMGTHRGPEFRPHWAARRGVGRWRIWPLPWPTAVEAAGRWTFVAALALVLAISAVALFIAVKIFENQPAAPPGPGPGPVPLPTPSSPAETSPTTPSPTTGTSPPNGPVGPGPTSATTAPLIV